MEQIEFHINLFSVFWFKLVLCFSCLVYSVIIILFLLFLQLHSLGFSCVSYDFDNFFNNRFVFVFMLTFTTTMIANDKKQIKRAVLLLF